jgi:6-phospho-beta-glucosidase
MKIAVIGGGSTYTPELFSGLLESAVTGKLPVREVVLEDIDGSRLDIIEPFCRRMMKKRGVDFSLRSTRDPADAVDGASFVLTQLRVGGNAARHQDELLGPRHGIIGQETTGIGGFAKALRTVPVIREIADLVVRKAPEAWLVNFTNPVSIVTQVLADRYPSLKWVGLCNYPYNIRKEVAEQLGLADDRGLFLEYTGLNHLSFVTRILLDGADVTERILAGQKSLKRMKNLPDDEFSPLMISSLGMIPSPYLVYYWNTRAVLEKQLKAGKTRAEAVTEVERELLELYQREDLDVKPEALEKRGGAYYSTVALKLMESLHNGTGDLHVLNVRNSGAIADLPADATVEVNCMVDRAGPHPLSTGCLPESIRPLVMTVKGYERFAARAAWTGNFEEAFLALLNHPLCGDSRTAEAALDDLIATNRKFLTGFERPGKEGTR